MKKITRRSGIVGAAILAAALVGLAATPANAATIEPNALRSGDTWTASTPDSGVVLHARPDGTTYETTTGAAPLLLSPVGSFECNVVNNATYLIKTYTSVVHAGGNTSSSIKLLCGDSNSGYLHITQKQADWQARVNAAGGGGAWDDLMDYSSTSSLQHPFRVVPQAGNKSCFTAPIVIKTSSGGSFTYNPTVVASNNNKLLITSYPSTVSSCK